MGFVEEAAAAELVVEDMLTDVEVGDYWEVRDMEMVSASADMQG